MFDGVVMADSAAGAVRDEFETWPDYVRIVPDVQADLPPRLAHIEGTDRASVQLAIAWEASLLLIDGKALLEKVKLSFIKSMGTIPLLIQAYQEGRIRAVKPLLVALEKKGHTMPPPEQMEAIRRALDLLE